MRGQETAALGAAASAGRRRPNGGRVAIGLALALGLVASAPLGCSPEHAFQGSVVGLPAPAPEIGGTNWNGEPFALAALRGRVAIVFFGYTSCPDICPFTLTKLKQLKQQLGAGAEDLAVVLVSVDPPRDDLARLSEYVQSFDPAFYGVRLEPDALAGVTASYFVGAFAREPSEPGGFYTVDHTGTLFVVDRQGRLRVRIGQDASLDEMRPDLAYLLAEAPPGGEGGASAWGGTGASSPLEVVDPVSHPSAGAAVGAVYLRIRNRGAQADRLLAVKSPAAERAELHETISQGGVMSMEHRTEGFAIPSGGGLDLAPGGRHIMLMGLREPLTAGGDLAVTLVFEQAGERTLRVPVVPRRAR